MPTELMWAAVSLNFRLNSYLFPTPFQWDHARHKFLFVSGGGQWDFFAWHFVIFGVYLWITIGASGYVIHGHISNPRPQIPLYLIVEYAILCVAAIFAVYLAACVNFHGEEIALKMNRIIQAYDDSMGTKYHGRKRGKRITLFGIQIPRLYNNQGKLDKPGIALMLLLTPVPFIPFFLAPIIVLIAEHDMYHFIFEDILPTTLQTNPGIKVLLILIRLGLTFLIFAENARIFPLCIYYMGIPVHIMAVMVNEVLKMRLGSTEMQWGKTLGQFTTLQRMVYDGEVEAGRNIFVIMGFGLVLSAFINFGSIRFVNTDLPTGFYALFPFLSCAVLVAIVALLPVGIGVYETSQKTLDKWAKEAEARRDALLRKRIKAARPLLFKAGLNGYYMYSLGKGILGTYIIFIVDYTVNLLIAMPDVNFVDRITFQV